jgi:hypothetical protein
VAGTGYAQGLQLEARTLLGRQYRAGGLLPLQLRVTNSGPENLDCLLQLEQASSLGSEVSSSERSLSLPGRSDKRLLVYLPVPATMSRVTASLKDRRGSVVAERELQLEPLERRERLVAVLGEDRVGLQSLRLADPAVYSSRVEAPLPMDWYAWQAADVVVWPDPEPSLLRQEVWEALQHWIESGGRLVVAVPRGRSPLAGSALEHLLPARVEQRVGVAPVPGVGEGPLPRGFLSQPRGEIVIGGPADPVAVLASVGHGTIAVVSPDLRSGQFRSGDTSREFWSRLLERVAPPAMELETDTHGRAGELAGMLDAVLASMPGVSPSAVGWVSALLGCYLLAIGPASWLLKRRVKTHSWSRFSYPAMVLLFTAGILCASTWYRQAATRVRCLVVEDWRDGVVSGHVIGALSSERSAVFTVSAEPPSSHFLGASRSLESWYYGYHQGAGDALAGARVAFGASASELHFELPAWAPALFRARWVGREEPALQVRPRDQGWQVTSRSPYKLGPVYLVHEGRFWRHDWLLPGATVQLSEVSDPAPLFRASFSYSYPDEQLVSMRAIAGPLSEAALAPALRAGSGADRNQRATPPQTSLDAQAMGLDWSRVASYQGDPCPVLVAFSQSGHPPLQVSDLRLVEALVVHRQTLCGVEP